MVDTVETATVLAELDEARATIAALEAENAKLKEDLAALTSTRSKGPCPFTDAYTGPDIDEETPCPVCGALGTPGADTSMCIGPAGSEPRAALSRGEG